MIKCLDDIIKSRRSVRRYKPVPVPPQNIVAVLDAGRQAPSAKNRQPWRFEVLTRGQCAEISQAMSDWYKENRSKRGTENFTAKIISSAPTVIAVFSSCKASASDYISVGACLENMSLKATELGLGSLIVCDTQSVADVIARVFRVKSELIALFVLGYPDEPFVPKQKMRLDELVTGIDVDLCACEEFADIADSLPEADIEKDPFVFISYSHRDRAVVLRDIIELKRSGVRLWYDKSIGYGEAWDEYALSVLDKPNCVGVVAYISDFSVLSVNVAKEIERASKRFEKGEMIGVHVGDKPMSEYAVAPELKHVFACFSQAKKYIPRSTDPAVPNTLPIVECAANLGAVSANGVYDDFSYARIDGGVVVTGYNGCSETVVFPSEIHGYDVIGIGKSAMRGNNSVRSVTVPDTVRSVDEGAFFQMQNLCDVHLPDTLQYLGVAVFRGCESLKSVVLPSGIRVLSEALFRDCTALEVCEVPSGVTEFGEAVFRGCTALKRVYAPTVKRMTEGGFYGCSELSDLTLPEDIVGLEEQSFATCPKVNIKVGGFVFSGGKAVKV